MKNIFYSILVICISCIFGCTIIGGGSGDPTPPPCDNQLSPFTLNLTWLGAYYTCTSGAFGISTPPYASYVNYISSVSANGTIGSLSNPDSYLCEITCKNDQPSENPNSPCSNPGIVKYTWNTAGTSLAIQNYENHSSDITVDYYDICAPCSGSIAEGRPHFIGTAGFQAGVSIAFIPMQTADTYVGAVGSPCQ